MSEAVDHTHTEGKQSDDVALHPSATHESDRGTVGGDSTTGTKMNLDVSSKGSLQTTTKKPENSAVAAVAAGFSRVFAKIFGGGEVLPKTSQSIKPETHSADHKPHDEVSIVGKPRGVVFLKSNSIDVENVEYHRKKSIRPGKYEEKVSIESASSSRLSSRATSPDHITTAHVAPKPRGTSRPLRSASSSPSPSLTKRQSTSRSLNRPPRMAAQHARLFLKLAAENDRPPPHNADINILSKTKKSSGRQETPYNEEAQDSYPEKRNGKRGKASNSQQLQQPWQPSPSYIESKRQEIISAASLVTRSLLTGPWPSPFKSVDPAAVARRSANEYKSHAAHMSMVGASIEQFARDVIAPAAIEQLSVASSAPPEPAAREGVAAGLRVFLGALLLIREILIQNAGSIFGPSVMITGREIDFGTTLNGMDDDLVTDEEAAIFSVTVLATTIILAGLAELGDVADEISNALLDMIESYDCGDDEFAFCLDEITDNITPVFPNQQTMGKHESVAWTLSMNLQREMHPISVLQKQVRQSKRQRLPEDGTTNSRDEYMPIQVPQPTAVHISFLQSR